MQMSTGVKSRVGTRTTRTGQCCCPPRSVPAKLSGGSELFAIKTRVLFMSSIQGLGGEGKKGGYESFKRRMQIKSKKKLALSLPHATRLQKQSWCLEHLSFSSRRQEERKPQSVFAFQCQNRERKRDLPRRLSRLVKQLSFALPQRVVSIDPFRLSQSEMYTF